MAVVPINLARVSNNLRAFNLLESVRQNQANLFQVQNQLSTGLKISKPSDDPIGAATALAVERRLDLIDQLERNTLHATNALNHTEAAMLDAVNGIMEVQNVASETVGDLTSADERTSLATVIDSALDQLVAIGNRQYLDAYLFSGHSGGMRPFELTDDGVRYNGDEGRTYTILDTDLGTSEFLFSGADAFAAVSTSVQGIVNLDPALTVDTRISDLRGTTGLGISLGRIEVSDGTEQVLIDLSGADTVGDLIDRLNEDMPDTLVASITEQSIQIAPQISGSATVTVRDVGGGQTARDLGLEADGLTLAGAGADLDPVLTLRSRLTDLNGGLGLDTTGGLTIRNGSKSATIDFSGAETMEDALNLINSSGVNVWARIAEDGESIEILNRVAGADLYIEENGGTLATALGVRSLHGGTELSTLNDGLGVETVDGNDLQITTSDGTTFEIDIDGANTLQDVIDLLNTAGSGAITASLVSTGNGISIVDNTTGAGTLTVARANLSPALDGLGLNVQATGNTLSGQDVNPVRVDNSFTALLELREALREDDTQGIAFSGERLERALEQMQEVQGRIASQARSVEQRAAGMENEITASRILLSDVRDVDIADAVVRFQQWQTALQANLQTSSRILNLSLMDYLG